MNFYNFIPDPNSTLSEAEQYANYAAKQQWEYFFSQPVIVASMLIIIGLLIAYVLVWRFYPDDSGD